MNDQRVANHYQKRKSLINGVFYETGLGCSDFPTCFACGYKDCQMEETNSGRRQWDFPYPSCLKYENCLECVGHNCREKVGLPPIENKEQLRMGI